MTTEADPIEISNLEVVHGLDEHVDALVPLLPVSWEPDQDRMPLAATIEAIPEFTVNDGDGMYVSSSLLSETDTWHVTDVTAAQDGVAHVAFGRGGEQEARFQLYGGAANGLRTGITILGTDILWTGGGFLGLGKAQVDFLPDPDPPAPITIMIPIMRLHRPKPEGCEATYYAEVSGGQNAEMTLKVLGVGAGGGFKITMKISEEYTARKSCVETVIPAKFQLIPGRTLVNGTEVAYGIRAKIIDPEPDKKELRAIPPSDDCCERPRSSVPAPVLDFLNIQSAPVGDTLVESISVEREIHGKLSVGFETKGNIPINLGVDYERTAQQTAKITTKMVSGSRYSAYGPNPRPSEQLEQQLEICWTTQP